MAGVTLDAGGLIAFERGDRPLDLLLARTREAGEAVTVPATVLAQVVRDPRRQVRLTRLTRHPMTDVVPLDTDDATAVGRLLAHSRTADIVDAHVMVCAARAAQAVVTSDPDDLRRLAPTIELVTI